MQAPVAGQAKGGQPRFFPKPASFLSHVCCCTRSAFARGASVSPTEGKVSPRHAVGEKAHEQRAATLFLGARRGNDAGRSLRLQGLRSLCLLGLDAKHTSIRKLIAAGKREQRPRRSLSRRLLSLCPAGSQRSGDTLVSCARALIAVASLLLYLVSPDGGSFPLLFSFFSLFA